MKKRHYEIFTSVVITLLLCIQTYQCYKIDHKIDIWVIIMIVLDIFMAGITIARIKTGKSYLLK